MKRFIEGEDRRQATLLPDSLADAPANHPTSQPFTLQSALALFSAQKSRCPHSRSVSAAGRSASAPSEPFSQTSKSSARSSTGMRSWYGVFHSDAPETITVQDRISSFVAGSIQRSPSPAKSGDRR
jgi:hypothetical protein